MHFRRTTVASVRRKRMSAQWLLLQNPREKGWRLGPGRSGGSDEQWPHTGYLKAKLPGLAVGQEVG